MPRPMTDLELFETPLAGTSPNEIQAELDRLAAEDRQAVLCTACYLLDAPAANCPERACHIVITLFDAGNGTKVEMPLADLDESYELLSHRPSLAESTLRVQVDTARRGAPSHGQVDHFREQVNTDCEDQTHRSTQCASNWIIISLRFNLGLP